MPLLQAHSESMDQRKFAVIPGELLNGFAEFVARTIALVKPFKKTVSQPEYLSVLSVCS
jgi:hypothetical protein